MTLSRAKNKVQNDIHILIKNPIILNEAGYRRNYGEIFEKEPILIVCPRNATEIKKLLKYAFDNNVRINIRGGGFSINEEAISSGILLVLDSQYLKSKIKLNLDNTVTVNSSTKWYVLEKELNKSSRAIPILISKIGMTVGGTLSTGGYSPGSVMLGSQMNLVEKFSLIKPDGTEIWCSKQTNREFFQYGLGTLGKIGVINTVVLRTVEHKPFTTVYKLKFSSAYELVSSLHSLSVMNCKVDIYAGYNVEDYFESLICFHFHTKEIAENQTFPFPDLKLPIHKFIVKDFIKDSFFELDWKKNFYFIWQVYAVGLDKANEFLNLIDQVLFNNEVYKRYGRFKLFISKSPYENGTFPFEPTPSNAQLTLGFGFNFSIPFEKAINVKDVEDIHNQIFPACLKLGGRPYIANSFGISDELKKDIYGEHFSNFEGLKRKVDPKMIFNL